MAASAPSFAGVPITITQQPATELPSAQRPAVLDQCLSSCANLSNLLPTGTVLAFQTLSPSFTNGGQQRCHAANRFMTAALVILCTVSCAFFTFTDSLTGEDGKLYYGVATRSGIALINFTGTNDEKRQMFRDMASYRMRWTDVVHAVFTVMLFLALCFSDPDVQGCLFNNADPSIKEMLRNLPLGLSFFSGLVFMVLPTTRKGIGYSDMAPQETRQGRGLDETAEISVPDSLRA